jgi:hypothetical protein
VPKVKRVLPDSPPGSVTTTSTEPGACTGVTAVMRVGSLTTIGVVTPSKVTVAPDAKPVPVIVTLVCAFAGPLAGEIAVTVGGEAKRTPTLLPPASVNQRFPSGPRAILIGFDPVASGIATIPGDWGVAVKGLMLPILSVLSSVNQRLPSGRAVMSAGEELAVGIAKSPTYAGGGVPLLV